jgi:hypothetical protein
MMSHEEAMFTKFIMELSEIWKAWKTSVSDKEIEALSYYIIEPSHFNLMKLIQTIDMPGYIRAEYSIIEWLRMMESQGGLSLRPPSRIQREHLFEEYIEELLELIDKFPGLTLPRPLRGTTLRD